MQRSRKCTHCKREKRKEMGRQSQLLASPHLSLLLHCLWFIRGGYDGWPGQGLGMAFWQEVERRRAKDQSVTVVVALWFTVSACCPFNSGHRKSNTIRILPCRVRYISSYVFWVFLYRKRKEKTAAVMSRLKGERRKKGKIAFSGHLEALVAQRNLIIVLFYTWWSVKWCGSGLPLAHSVFPSTTGLDYISVHSLTHLLPCAPFPADG